LPIIAIIRRVAINRSRDHLRSSERRRRRERFVSTPSHDVDSESMGSVDSSLRFRRLLQTLPDQQRFAAGLHYLEDLPVAEIAACLGISSGAVKYHLNQAMASSHDGRFDNDDTMANDEFDLRLDELLRREFARSFSEEEEPKRVLAGMAPAIRRAHRIHRFKQAAVGTVAVPALAAGGLGLMARSSPTDEARLTVAGESESPPVNPDLGQELVVTGTTARSTSDRSDRGEQRDDGANTSATRTSTTEPSGSTEPTIETAVSSTVTTASNTSVALDGTITIDSACGSIVVGGLREPGQADLRFRGWEQTL
jgi:hypothetical protein